MAYPTNVSAGTKWNLPNYLGELFCIGANQTPFLNMIGGIGGAKVSPSMEFPTAQPWALNAASQPAITETASLTAPTAVSYVRGQAINTCQIFQKQVAISYVKQADMKTLFAGGLMVADGSIQPVDEKAFQIQGALAQVAVDADYSFLQGTYASASSASVAASTRGIVTAVVSDGTNYIVNSPAATLTRAMMDQLFRTMAAAGAPFQNCVLWANAFQIQKISNLYAYAPMDRTVGGVAIKQILTDFGSIGVAYEPHMPTGSILVADMSVVSPVVNPVPSKGVMFYEPLAKVGASELGQVYGHLGIDYGPVTYHGVIAGLATS